MYPFKSTFAPLNSTSNLGNSSSSNDVQWPNKSSYQNVDLEHVDWAALAQQWIHMKEVCPSTELMPDAPPPPNISKPDKIQLPAHELEEQGEAPMEVERDDEPSFNEDVATFPTFPSANVPPSNWENQSQDMQSGKQWNNKSMTGLTK